MSRESPVHADFADGNNPGEAGKLTDLLQIIFRKAENLVRVNSDRSHDAAIPGCHLHRSSAGRKLRSGLNNHFNTLFPFRRENLIKMIAKTGIVHVRMGINDAMITSRIYIAESGIHEVPFPPRLVCGA